MNTTFAMWRKTLSQLIKMEDKKEWDALDILSKWFIATRSAVGTITLYSGLIGGLFAWQYLRSAGRPFNFLMWVMLTLGLFIAHGTNNLINDYIDFSHGIDKDNYFRTQYGVHPLAQGFWNQRTHLLWFGVSGLLATLAGVYALFYTNFAPIAVWFFAIGAFILLFYTYPLKYIGIGELSIFIIWGPMMIGDWAVGVIADKLEACTLRHPLIPLPPDNCHAGYSCKNQGGNNNEDQDTHQTPLNISTNFGWENAACDSVRATLVALERQTF